MKRILSIGLVMLFLAGAVTVTAENTAPEADLIIAGLDTTQYRSWSDHAFFAAMDELTGLHVGTRQFVSAEEWKKYKSSMTKGDADMPDALFMAQLSQAECETMTASGVLIDLKPYLEECCPNLTALLDRFPAYRDAITLKDGTIPALPYINETPSQNVMWINKKFLSRVRMQAPNTLEELEAVLRAFKAADCNGNGRAEDEKPLGFMGPFDLKFLAHAFGIVANDYNLCVRDGQVVFAPAEDDYRLFIAWCRDMYAAGLLDKDGFTTSDALREVTDEKKDQVYGIVLAPLISNFLPAQWQADYEPLMPLEFEGRRVYRDFGTGLIRGTFAVTSHCKDVPAALRWVDALYGEEGAVLAAVGKRNRDFLVDGDGTWRLTESSKSNSYYTITNVLSSSVAYPGYSADDFQSRYGDADLGGVLKALKDFNSYCVLPFPYVSLTNDQASRISELQAKLGPMVDIAIAQWVLGERDLTEETYSAFVTSLKEAGMDEFLALWQDVYDGRDGE